MTVEEHLKSLMIKKAGSVNKFAQMCGVSQSTIASVFTRGVGKANIKTIIKICRTLEISADELVEGRITPLQYMNYDVEYIDLCKLSEENQKRIKEYYEMLIELQKGKK